MKVKYFLTFCAILICFGCASKPHVPPTLGVMYTSYNIWKHRSPMFCINFKVGQDIIPAGTKVYDIKVKKVKIKTGGRRDIYYYIQFKLVDTGEKISVKFNSRWHPRESAYTYRMYMFTHLNFEELTEGLSHDEILAIKMGGVIERMSKRAVRISYGYPPEHVNKGFSENKWVYWINKLKRKYIFFDENGKVISRGP